MAFGPRVGDAGFEEAEDLGPPGVDGVSESGCFGQISGEDSLMEAVEPIGDGGPVGGREQHPKAFLDAQAARTSPVGSLLSVKLALSRSSARGESRSPARSSSRRLAHAGSVVRPRRPSCSRKTRWRTSVTICPASRSRWK